MSKNKKRVWFRINVLLLLFVFMIAATFSFFMPQKAFAYINTDEELSRSEQQDRTILYALRVCLEYSNFKSDTNRDELEEGPMPPIFEEGGALSATPTGSVAVGYEIEPGDGNAPCNGLSLTRAMRFIDKDRAWFINGLYNRCGSNEVPPKYCFDEDGKNRIKSEIERLAERKRNGPGDGQAVGPKERARRHLIAINKCLRPIGNDLELEGDEIVKIDGKKYKYRDGKDSGSNIAVGHDLETDGNASCGGLIDYFKSHPGLLERTGGITGNDGGSNPGQGGDDASVNDVDCSGGGALGWIICPVFELGANMTQEVFDNMIRPMMEQVPVDTKGPFYKAWQNFRFLGNIVLIGAMLALVYAQARGGGR